VVRDTAASTSATLIPATLVSISTANPAGQEADGPVAASAAEKADGAVARDEVKGPSRG
jgi:hypothetical protein